MASRTLNVTITGDARSLNRALGQVQDQTGKVETRLTKFSTVAKGALAGAAAGGAVLLTKGLFDSIHAAEEAQVSQSKLQTQLKASGLSYRAHAAEIDRAIQKTSQLAGLDDEDLQDAFTNIVRVTGDVNKSLRLTGLAADFARAKHLDVAKAGEIVGKVAGGNTGILSRYGIAIEKGASATEALGKLQQKFSGQAAAYGRTAAGAQDRFRVAVENLEEAIGKKLLPVIARAANGAARFINQMQAGTGAGGRFAKAMGELAETMRPIVAVAGRVGSAIASNMDKIATAVKIATFSTRALVAVIERVASVEIAVAKGAVAAGKAIGGGLASAARTVAGIFREVAGAVQSVVDKVNALLSLIPRIKFPKIPKIPFISTAGAAIRPDSTPGPSTRLQQQFASSDVELAQTDLNLQGINPLASQHRAAEQRRQKLISSRLNQVRKRRAAVEKALARKGLKSKTRKAFTEEWLSLTAEEATLAGEMNSLASDIAGDAPAAPDDIPAGLADQLSDIGLHQQAGDLSEEESLSQQIAALDATLAAGGLTDHQILAIRAAKGQVAAALEEDRKRREEEQKQATADLAQAMKDLQASIDKQTAFGQSVAATEAGAMARWVTSVVSRVQGQDVLGRGLTPAYGVARRS